MKLKTCRAPKYEQLMINVKRIIPIYLTRQYLLADTEYSPQYFIQNDVATVTLL